MGRSVTDLAPAAAAAGACPDGLGHRGSSAVRSGGGTNAPIARPDLGTREAEQSPVEEASCLNMYVTS